MEMRNLIVSSNVTVDGRNLDEPRDWVLQPDDEEFVARHTELLRNSDGLILGRKTYEMFASRWPSRSGEYPDLMNGIAKYVASTTLEDPDWENSSQLRGDVSKAVAELKRQPGRGLIVYGSLDLVHGLLEDDLVDEFQLWVHPVVLGMGRSFFPEGVERTGLDLVNATAISSGVVILNYGRST
jgi:dihydrofolate reductase